MDSDKQTHTNDWVLYRGMQVLTAEKNRTLLRLLIMGVGPIGDRGV